MPLLIKFLFITAILLSFKSNSIELPKHSSLVKVEQKNYHVRTLGEKKPSKPSIIMLSGPNLNWHSDSAWFSLLQPLLAKHYHTVAIDRAGNAWSDGNKKASYSEFTKALPQIINKLALNDIILVSYASSNISSIQLAPQYKKLNIKAMLWLDPDIMLEDAIKLYTSYPADWYQKNIQKILPHVAQGKWTEKTIKKNALELEHIKKITPKNLQTEVDWNYINTIFSLRTNIQQQQTRAIEISNYEQDLKSIPLPVLIPTIPTSIIDTDFELQDVKRSDENYKQLVHWQKIGSDWSKKISQESGGQYLPINNADHLVTFEHPYKIIKAVTNLAKGIK